MTLNLEILKKAIKDFEEIFYQTSQIIFINYEDFLLIDLEEIPSNVFFICNPYLEKGKAFVIKDGTLKRDMHRFCCEHPDMVFRGRK